jgi:hypothetical protein
MDDLKVALEELKEDSIQAGLGLVPLQHLPPPRRKGRRPFGRLQGAVLLIAAWLPGCGPGAGRLHLHRSE